MSRSCRGPGAAGSGRLRSGDRSALGRLLWGDADPFFPLAFGKKLAAAFPDAAITPVPGASTFVSMEYPEQVADVIAQQA